MAFGVILIYVYYVQGSWKLELRNGFKNFRRDHQPKAAKEKQHHPSAEKEGPPAKRLRIESTTQITEEEYTEAVRELKEEHKKSKKNRSQVRVKELMEATYSGRRKWIMEERPFVGEVLDAFPPLKGTKPVSLL